MIASTVDVIVIVVAFVFCLVLGIASRTVHSVTAENVSKVFV